MKSLYKLCTLALLLSCMTTLKAAPGDSFSNALVLPMNTTVARTFEASNQREYFTFTAPVTGRYQIASALGVSTRFTLYEANQKQINYYSNEYVVELTTGTTYYLATEPAGNTAGAYSFSITEPITVDGKGGTLSTAIPNLPMDTPVSGSFNVPGKADYYHFTAPLTGRYRIHTEGLSLPVRFTMYNSNRTQINYYNNEYLIDLVAGTSYYLAASSVSSSVKGAYTFMIDTPILKDGKGSTFATAIELQAANTVMVSGELNVSGMEDYYKFTATHTGKYVITTDGITIPIRFTLYNANQSQINYYTNRYEADLVENTTYYLGVEATNVLGAYSFAMYQSGSSFAHLQAPEALPIPPAVTPIPPTPPAPVIAPFPANGNGTTFTQAMPLTFNVLNAGRTLAKDQTEYYAFAVPVTGKYLIKSDAGISLRFHLYNANQTSVNYYNNEYLVSLVAGDIYYLGISSANTNEVGAYSFTVTSPDYKDGNGGSFENAIAAGLDQTISGNFNVKDKSDYYIFAAPVTGRYAISTDGVSQPVRFTVYNDNQTQINYYTNEYLINLVAGKKYYVATTEAQGNTGTYNFRITTPYTVDRKGGAFHTAISVQTATSGNLNVVGKVDYYIITPRLDADYAFMSETGIPLRFTIYNANQSQINYYNNRYEIELKAGTTYYLAVEAMQSRQTGEYTFSVSGYGATGVEQINAMPRTAVGYYNLHGVRMTEAPQKGIYIVVYDDGSTQKVVR